MPVVDHFEFKLDVSSALKRKGILAGERRRSNALREIRDSLSAEQAALLRSLYVYDFFPVEERLERGYVIGKGRLLESKAAFKAFRGAGLVALLVYTIGPLLEERAQEYRLGNQHLESMVLDAFGSLAVSEVGRVAYEEVRRLAEGKGLKASVPLNPGTTHWPMAGQRVFFDLLPLAEAGFTLDPAGFIHPRHTISMAIGLGDDVLTPEQGSSCDFCADPDLCRRSDHYRMLA